MDDCISRQMAIDALMERFKRVPTNAIIAKDVIENLPFAQPEQRWIPCRERLPEKSGYYLATIDIGLKAVDVIFFNNGSGFLMANTVKAWKPTPEPYQEGGE